MITKDQLLSELLDTYVQLRPSAVAGIGVFAIRDIPQGCRSMFSVDSGEWIKVFKSDIAKLPNAIQLVVQQYCTFDREYFYIEKTGFKKMDLCCFVNHSDVPNIAPVEDGKYFEASRDILMGEELFIDYALVADESV